MSIWQILYTPQTPYINKYSVEDRSGIYLVVCYSGDQNKPIDVGESANVKTNVDHHDKKNCWTKHGVNTLIVAVYFTLNLQQIGRMKIEQGIRCNYSLPL